MKLYDQLTRKQRRTITYDIALIMSLKGLAFPKTIEDLKEVGVFGPNIYGGRVYFTNEGVQAIRRICFFIEQTDKYHTLLIYNDIFQTIISEIDRWFNNELVPDCKEFLDPLYKKLSNLIKTFTFVCRVEGISLDGINEISIGGKVIQPYDPNFITGISYSTEKIPKRMRDEYSKSLVISGKEVGSHDGALERFYYNAEMCLSVIRLYSCVLFKDAINSIQIRLVNTCHGAYGNASCLGWSNERCSPLFTVYYKSDQEAKIDKQILKNLKQKYFFDDFSRIINKKDRTELEESILKSVYWFGEAQKDRFRVSKWIKLWSCMECFFTIKHKGISEALSRGITSILVAGGYSHKEYFSYNDTKNKIKRFYNLRSKAIHRAEYNHIERIDLEEFSYIVAFVIITMIPLTLKGYDTLRQVRRSAIRLDKVVNSKLSIFQIIKLKLLRKKKSSKV